MEQELKQVGWLIYKDGRLDGDPFVPIHRIGLTEADRKAGYTQVPVYAPPPPSLSV